MKRFFSFVCSVVCDIDDSDMFVTYCNFPCPFLLYRHKASYNFVLGHLSFFNSVLLSFGPFLQFTRISFSLLLSFQALSTLPVWCQRFVHAVLSPTQQMRVGSWARSVQDLQGFCLIAAVLLERCSDLGWDCLILKIDKSLLLHWALGLFGCTNSKTF